MKQRKIIPVTTVLLISVALIVGAAWAGSIEIPVSGTQEMTTTDPGRVWIDEDGITHYRGLVIIAVIEGQDLDGVSVTGDGYYVFNINIDMATGNGDLNITISTEMTYGDLVGAWRGRGVATITGFFIDGTFNYFRGYDDFEGWHMRGVHTSIFGGTTGQWEGIFHIPGGGGGNKAAASETWSAVKALYR